MANDQERTKVASGNKQKTILLIEDDPIFSKILVWMISRHTPHRVIHISDGSQILQQMSESQPSLLVLDYELPGMNGIELYDLVHATAGMEDIPAVMASSSLPHEELAQRNIVGISKPCRTEDFLRVIEKALA
ncbi:MAG TPA: response regulator [Ktedonosporobacter sp.]|nr:response regulator [Ktedonosporobacter sp.]